jgi:hypothetical protein
MKRRNEKNAAAEDNFAAFFWVRVLGAVVIAVAVIWAAALAIGYLEKFQSNKDRQGEAFKSLPATGGEGHAGQTTQDKHGATDHSNMSQSGEQADATAVSKNQAVHSAPKAKAIQHGVAVHGDAASIAAAEDRSPAETVRGVAFVSAVIKPLEFELQERRLGWRPNDVVQYTDNVNNFQLGVLEATRRATTRLAERISRTGTTNVLDENLERAMNCFMIDPDSYLLPSAESKYEEGLEELRTYKKRLIAGDAEFYTRADNLIPLLVAFADLLGSCDDNLVKATEKDGTPVSTFAADDYFYYAKGVASAVLPILEAVAEDFQETLITRRAMDVLHHAIHACREASEMAPLIVLEGDMDGIFANHRANMAAHISHARFYLDVLAATLST